MITATRRELLQQMTRLSELAPDMRLGQLIANLAAMDGAPWDETLWELEDDKLLAAATEFAAVLERRNASVV
jgi:hypothetical protein